ncbi:unnamed protein product [Adineta steineri]|uniref:14-3-3 domain-containing protein n=1 Tax=Adineta steineri TaxID=433720 RepID=A0A819TFV3_9BILA|nr:unnamed protein product [Adineta steineri]CAF4087179.1 unnamed protein product [Adineta steineri]
MTNKDEQVELAKLAEQAERYDDMMVAMKKVVETNSNLMDEELNLFSLAYKQVVNAYRLSWQTLSSIAEANEEGSELQQKIIKEYQKKIEKELKDVCHELLTLLDKYIKPKARTTESQLFYLKMKGDYYRYLTEVTTNNERQMLAEESELAYKNGFEMAKNHMIATNPIRLRLALNLSIFYYEILNETDVACRLAKEAFDDGLNGLAILGENAYKGRK